MTTHKTKTIESGTNTGQSLLGMSSTIVSKESCILQDNDDISVDTQSSTESINLDLHSFGIDCNLNGDV